MEQQVTRSPAPIAGILAIGGGVLLALGSFLAWAEVSGGGTSVTASGIDGSDGWITLICGLLVLFAGVMLLRAGGRRAVAIVAVAAGLVGGGVGLYDALTAKDRVLDDAAEELAGQFGATAEAVRTILDEAIEAGELGISISIGLYMVIAGGALGVVGGILGMRRAPQQVAAPVTASASPAVAIPDTPAAQDPSSVAMAPDPSGMPAPPPVEDEAGQPPGP